MSAPNWGLVSTPEPTQPPPPAFVPSPEQVAVRQRNAAETRKRHRKANREQGIGLPQGQNPCTAEIDYTADEVEFATALDRYKREKRRPFPTTREILKVLLDLGYRKEANPCDSTPVTSLPSTNSGA